MTEMKDPVRLQLGGSAGAQGLLRSARADAPSRAQLDHLAARLAPTVTIAPVASTTPWLLAGAAVVGALAIAMFVRNREPTPVAYAPVIAIEASEPVADPMPAQVVAPESPIVPSVIAEAPRPRAKQPVAPVVVEDIAPAVVEPAPAPVIAPPRPREIELLDPAHAALRTGDMQRALALATEHRKLYPSGALGEEREAIAIEALQRLGDRTAARTRFVAFVTAFPRSSYRARLERLVAN